jgi:glucose/arabinose dehydrogenase
MLAALALALAPATACVADEAAIDIGQPEGFSVSEVVTGLEGPTQIANAPDGRLLVAQLNGGESDGTGQILAVDLEGQAGREVLFSDLDKPTGVEVLGGEVWVMEQNRLSRGPLEGGELEVVLDDLPFNGRSEGTLTVTADGELLYDTSGRLASGEPVDGSGTLLSLRPGEEPVVVATGLKHAYARTFDEEGNLWQTEVSDGTFDGEPAPDELMLVEPGDDFGWPRCVGDRTPVAERGGSEAICRSAAPSHALFPPGSTPTSVAPAPWDPDRLLVALWNEGLIVGVSRSAVPPVEPEPFATGIERPQHLLVDGDRLLVSDHGGGRILAIAAPS